MAVSRLKLIILDENNRVLSHTYKRALSLPATRLRGRDPLKVADTYTRRLGIRPKNVSIISTMPDAYYYCCCCESATECPKNYEWRSIDEFPDATEKEKITTAIRKQKLKQTSENRN